MKAAFDGRKAADGGDYFIGKRLKTLLREAGFVDLEFTASCRVFSSPEEVVNWARLAHQWIDDTATKAYLIGQGETAPDTVLDLWRSEYERWSKDPDAVVVQVRCSVVGRKP